MPAIGRSNNKILPANARNADVAEKAVREIVPVQQRQQYSAFRVQGIEVIHYSRLNTGRVCTCQGTEKQINSILGEDGKASAGTINELLTGNMNFGVTPYNQNQQRVTKDPTQTSPWAPTNKNQGVFDIAVASNENDIPFADLINGRGFGDNGPASSTSIDDLAGEFDASLMGFSDAACPICFGSGFIGGYTPFHAHRQVMTVVDVQVIDGELDMLARPLAANCTGFNAQVVLPRGAIGIDVFRVWNGTTPLPAVFTVDGNQIGAALDMLKYCDGKPHIINVSNIEKFTHFEMQFTLTTESLYFEFPKRPSSSNIALLEQDEPFNIIASPNIPTMESQDIIVEQQKGKVLVVMNVNPWNTRNRSMLGWEARVRVIQTPEIYRLLPNRGRTLTKPPTTEMVRDNGWGSYRT